MNPQSLPVCVYERLFVTAERLQWQWRNTELSDTFDSRMIHAVLRRLDRRPLPAGASEADLVRHACRLLRYIWKRNARRDHARLMQARVMGKLPEFCSLDCLYEETGFEPETGLYAGSGQDEDAGEWGRAVVQQLIAWGMAREWAWAVVWRASGRTLDDVAFLMTERFQCDPIAQKTLESWDRRTFKAVMARLRKVFGSEPEPYPDSYPVASRHSTSTYGAYYHARALPATIQTNSAKQGGLANLADLTEQFDPGSCP